MIVFDFSLSSCLVSLQFQESRAFTGTVRTPYAIVLLNNLKNKILAGCDGTGTIVLCTAKVDQAEHLYPGA